MTTFSTYEYELSHGHKPKGRGSWAFIGMYGPNVSRWISDETLVFVPGSMTLTEAKKAIRQMYPGVKVWEVAP